MTDLAYWIFNYRPHWEACSKEVQCLSAAMRTRFDVRLISLTRKEPRPCWNGREVRLPLSAGMALMPLLIRSSRRVAINHLFASPEERWLAPRLAAGPAVLTLAKGARSVAAYEQGADVLRRFKFVVVECARDRELLCQLGIREERIRTIYPGVELRPHITPAGPFTILFATSPFAKHDLLSRGIHLILRAAQRLRDVRFLLIWRRSRDALRDRLLREIGVGNVEVRSGYIADMDAVYGSVHATILPGLDPSSLKPCPHSALESLAHGKPILVSRPTSIANLIETGGCGVVFEPTVEALESAVHELQQGYIGFQARCQPMVEQTFSRRVFVQRYEQLYQSMQ